ncbi:hypothetical protein HAX54_051335, partial [Datura stramonium]|nr:hypothetical protein [Datura stramonium]
MALVKLLLLRYCIGSNSTKLSTLHSFAFSHNQFINTEQRTRNGGQDTTTVDPWLVLLSRYGGTPTILTVSLQWHSHRCKVPVNHWLKIFLHIFHPSNPSLNPTPPALPTVDLGENRVFWIKSHDHSIFKSESRSGNKVNCMLPKK